MIRKAKEIDTDQVWEIFSKVIILDVTDKNNVIKISDITYPQLGYTHQGWFTEDHRYFLLGDETDEQDFGMNTRILVFDFQNLDNSVLSSRYLGTSRAINHNGYVKRNEFFIASFTAGMRVLDLTNIGSNSNSLVETGYFDTYLDNDDTAFNGAWSVYRYFASGNILIANKTGLFVVRKSGTLSTPNEVFQKLLFYFSKPYRKQSRY